MTFQSAVVPVQGIVCEFLTEMDQCHFRKSTRQLFERVFASMTSRCDPDQKKVIRDICLTSRCHLITGSPGTGKSFVIRIACELLNWFGLSVEICAPTGIAAGSINGKTICRQFTGLSKLKDNWNLTSLEPIRSSQVLSLEITANVLFIDEISMVTPSQMEQIIFMCQHSGIRICLFGDFMQLPCIIDNKNETRKHFFQNKWMGDFVKHQLITNHRQDEKEFIEFIMHVGKGYAQNPSVKTFIQNRKNAYVDICKSGEVDHVTHLFYRNKEVDEWNSLRFEKLPGERMKFPVTIYKVTDVKRYQTRKTSEITYESSDSALIESDHIDSVFQKYHIKEVELKEGCSIIFTRNVYKIPFYADIESSKLKLGMEDVGEDVEIYNGTQARVLKLHKDEGIQISFGKGTLFFPLRKYSIQLSHKHHASFNINGKSLTDTMIYVSVSYLPCVLGYSLSIHRAQGLSLDQAVISLPFVREIALAYVAVSRVKTQNGLFLKDFNFANCTIDPLIEKFNSGLLTSLPRGLHLYLKKQEVNSRPRKRRK